MSKESPPQPPKPDDRYSPEAKSNPWFANFSPTERGIVMKAMKKIIAQEPLENFTKAERELLYRMQDGQATGQALRAHFEQRTKDVEKKSLPSREKIMADAQRVINALPELLEKFKTSEQREKAAMAQAKTVTAPPPRPEAPVQEEIFLPEDVVTGCNVFTATVRAEVPAINGEREGAEEKPPEVIDREVYAAFQKLRAAIADWRREYPKSSDVVEEAAKAAREAVEIFNYFRERGESGESGPLLYPLSDNTAWLTFRDIARSMAKLYAGESPETARIAEIGAQAMPTENLATFVGEIISARKGETLGDYLAGIKPLLHLFSPDQRLLLEYLKRNGVDITKLRGVRYLTRNQIENITLRMNGGESFEAVAVGTDFDVETKDGGLLEESEELRNHSGDYRELAEEVEDLSARARIILMLDRIDAMARKRSNEAEAGELGEAIEEMTKFFGESLAAQWTEKELPKEWKREAATRCLAYLQQGFANLVISNVKRDLLIELKAVNEGAWEAVEEAEPAAQKKTPDAKGPLFLEELLAETKKEKPKDRLPEGFEEEAFARFEQLKVPESIETQHEAIVDSALFGRLKEVMSGIRGVPGTENLVAQIEYVSAPEDQKIRMRITINYQQSSLKEKVEGRETSVDATDLFIGGRFIFSETIAILPEDLPKGVSEETVNGYADTLRTSIGQLVELTEKSWNLLKSIGSFELPAEELPLLRATGVEEGSASSVQSLLLHPPTFEDAQAAIKRLNRTLQGPYPALTKEVVRNMLGAPLATAGKIKDEPERQRMELSRFAILYNGLLRLAVNPQIRKMSGAETTSAAA